MMICKRSRLPSHIFRVDVDFQVSTITQMIAELLQKLQRAEETFDSSSAMRAKDDQVCLERFGFVKNRLLW
jgi:hypothetical protein